MAWETVLLKLPASRKHHGTHKHDWLCPKCEGAPFTIILPSGAPQPVAPEKISADVSEYRILICDRCHQWIAFEGCTGDCAPLPKAKCEICEKYYCKHCGIVEDLQMEERIVELRYCHEHVPEWYKNR